MTGSIVPSLLRSELKFKKANLDLTVPDVAIAIVSVHISKIKTEHKHNNIQAAICGKPCQKQMMASER